MVRIRRLWAGTVGFGRSNLQVLDTQVVSIENGGAVGTRFGTSLESSGLRASKLSTPIRERVEDRIFIVHSHPRDWVDHALEGLRLASALGDPALLPLPQAENLSLKFFSASVVEIRSQ